MSPEGVTSLGLKNLDWVFGIWLILIVIWNFGYPQATPIEDVMITVILAGLSYRLNRTN